MFILVVLMLYFLPTIGAIVAQKRNAQAVFILNLVLGWTAIGWAAALIWAATKDAPREA